MLEIIITSSLLILIVIAARFLFRRKLSPILTYALWAIVALRLLLPVSFAQSQVSVMNLLPQEVRTAQHDTQTQTEPQMQTAPDTAAPQPGESEIGAAIEAENELPSAPVINTQRTRPAPDDILLTVWLSGVAVTSAYIIASNLRLYRKLKKSRKPFMPQCRLPVYIAGDLRSPCLFGIFRPAIYLNSFAAQDEQRTAFIIAHETVHYRHLDHIWAAVRMLCVAVHWYNPLVWAAAHLSRQDSELACDSTVIRYAGEENRYSYGRTLIDMISVKLSPSDALLASTAMSSGGKSLKERISMIKIKPKTIIWAAVAVCIVLAAAAAVTFTGAASDERDIVSDPDTLVDPMTCPDLLARYSTSYNTANEGRSHNLELAAGYINGYVLNPGESFLFNNVVGERAPERGFVKATGYTTEYTDENYGVGICQTSTTLFNAAFLAGLTIDERWSGRYVSQYYDTDGNQCCGNDSVVSWGGYDLKFTNNSDYPMRIEMTFSDGELTASIYGTDTGARYEMQLSETAQSSYGTIYYPAKEGKYNRDGQNGGTVDVYRYNTVSGESECMYTVTYQPLFRIIYTDSLPQGKEYSTMYYDSKTAAHEYEDGKSPAEVWDSSELAYILEDVPVFDGGYLEISCHLRKGQTYHPTNSLEGVFIFDGYEPEINMVRMLFNNITPGYIDGYIDILTSAGFTHVSVGTDDPTFYIAYNAPAYGIGVQIEYYNWGKTAAAITFFEQRDGCYGFKEPIGKG